ncbi:patatin family protein [Anaerolentibacter hominis]|uniref:patatin-like phospholipase family protein n=1 Tax=Anaerolentibacter hominis TaxID=3079009 RepID=UPI0031B85307
MSKIGLVLEGGATRGVFTAGVLDYLMEQNIYFPYVVGVSAGACNAVDYVSEQIGRTRDCMIHENRKNSYYGLRRLARTGHLLDLKRVFSEYPYKLFPFDFQTYFKSEIVNEIVVTNCLNGKAEYHTEKSSEKRLMELGQASSSMPLLTNMVCIDHIPYLDGGLADSVPYERAFSQGCDKVVVVLTHKRGYVPRSSDQMDLLFARKYHDYPNLLRTIRNRPQMYQKQTEGLKKLQEEGKALVIQPLRSTVKRMETNAEKLTSYYGHGYQSAVRRLEEIKEFIGQA